MVEAAADPHPATGLAAVAALRGLVEVLEDLQVDNARAKGWSWRDIARALGVTKQATHYKHARRRAQPAVWTAVSDQTGAVHRLHHRR